LPSKSPRTGLIWAIAILRGALLAVGIVQEYR
jgi:hypothetical protein